MVKHMRESHSAFVENAQMKIDRSEENSFEAKKAAQSVNTAAQCPECKLDCRTRKKLVRHMETDHKETGAEPEVKIIRLEKDSKDKLIDEIQKEQLQDHTLHAQKTKVVNNLIHAVAAKDGKSEVVLPETKKTIQVSATSIKLSRYRCFWCDMSFRKRGKLMDHINLFHKMSLEQTEIEAELIHISVVENDAKKATTAVSTKEKKVEKRVEKKAEKKVKEHHPTSKKGHAKHSSKKKQKVPAAMKQSSVYKHSVSLDCPETPNNKVCSFTLVGSIREVSRILQKRRFSSESDKAKDSCIFFNRKKDDPIPPAAPVEPPKPPTPKETAAITNSYHPNFTSIFSPPQSKFYHSSNSGMHVAAATSMRMQSLLPGPKSMHTGINSAFHTYQQQINFVQDTRRFYMSPPQSAMGIIDEYQQPTHGYNLTINKSLPASAEAPLDLTVPKYRWNYIHHHMGHNI
ncbi:hypothetical protein EB796_000110 [Bugula neritina]|uniref:C2H2-type domain-containing protein n=1 Tax=Bugula neritina TaxID=10212 RepID=A0A7J7KTV2_BUGNE|nr:hypothetical protein EB796_000110 [Bugula neritina]